MKIPGSDGNDSKIKLSHDSLSSDKTAAKKAQQTAAASTEKVADATASKSDSIKVSSLGSALRSELDPAKMAAERRAKIDALKKSIKDGTYLPPGLGVAQSVSDEISTEILLGGNQTKDSTTDSDSGLL